MALGIFLGLVTPLVSALPLIFELAAWRLYGGSLQALEPRAMLVAAVLVMQAKDVYSWMGGSSAGGT